MTRLPHATSTGLSSAFIAATLAVAGPGCSPAASDAGGDAGSATNPSSGGTAAMGVGNSSSGATNPGGNGSSSATGGASGGGVGTGPNGSSATSGSGSSGAGSSGAGSSGAGSGGAGSGDGGSGGASSGAGGGGSGGAGSGSGSGGTASGASSGPTGGADAGRREGGSGGVGGSSGASGGGDGGTGAFGLNGPSKCTGSAFAICEDFESTAAGSLPTGWTKEGSWAMAVSTMDKARGSQSLQIQVGVMNNQRGFIHKTNAQLGALATKHYGRIFFKLQNPPTKFVHWDFFHGAGPFGAGVSNDVRWGFTGTGTFTYLFNVQHSPGGEFGNNAPDKLAIDQWICGEWLLDSTAAGGGEADYWLNGTELPSLHRTGNNAQIPVFDAFGIGWELFNATDTPSVAYIDEVVFDSARVGCTN
jgi:hypothetical protein